MGTKPIAAPTDFSRQIIDFTRTELVRQGHDLSGRWLAAEIGMSLHYIYRRLSGEYPFTTNDIGAIAHALGYSSAAAFVVSAQSPRLERAS